MVGISRVLRISGSTLVQTKIWNFNNFSKSFIKRGAGLGRAGRMFAFTNHFYTYHRIKIALEPLKKHILILDFIPQFLEGLQKR